jgi:alpha-1,2-mannosyltransferase
VFADARWLNAKRIVVYSRLLVALYAAVILIVLALSPHFIDPIGRPVGTDFVCFWTTGKLVLEGHAADNYDSERHFAAEKQALPMQRQTPFLPWFYPPTFLIVTAALALMPYGLALGVWIAATLPVYLVSIRAILPGWTATMAALAFPAVLLNLAHGQNGFLTTGLLGGALLLLDRRPWISGALFGLLAFKPQFGVLVPLALLAGGYWRTICAAVFTVAATVAGSLAMWGTDPWRGFFDAIHSVSSYGLAQGSDGLEKLQSVFAGVRMLGGGTELAWLAQTAFALMSAAAVVWIWRRPASPALRFAALCTASLMVSPYLFDYDLTILALPIAWLVSQGLSEGFLPWEKTILFATWLMPLLSRTMGKYLHLPAAPVVMVLLLGITLNRARRFDPAPKLSS